MCRLRQNTFSEHFSARKNWSIKDTLTACPDSWQIKHSAILLTFAVPSEGIISPSLFFSVCDSSDQTMQVQHRSLLRLGKAAFPIWCHNDNIVTMVTPIHTIKSSLSVLPVKGIPMWSGFGGIIVQIGPSPTNSRHCSDTFAFVMYIHVCKNQVHNWILYLTLKRWNSPQHLLKAALSVFFKLVEWVLTPGAAVKTVSGAESFITDALTGT